MKKGYIYTLEAGIAISIVMIALILILSTQKPSQPLSIALIKQQGMEAIEFLDQKNELRQIVYAADTNTLENRLKTLLPPTISIKTDICSTDCSASVPADRTVISVDYYVSGYRDIFFNRKVRLWMWGKF